MDESAHVNNWCTHVLLVLRVLVEYGDGVVQEPRPRPQRVPFDARVAQLHAERHLCYGSLGMEVNVLWIKVQIPIQINKIQESVCSR